MIDHSLDIFLLLRKLIDWSAVDRKVYDKHSRCSRMSTAKTTSFGAGWQHWSSSRRLGAVR